MVSWVVSLSPFTLVTEFEPYYEAVILTKDGSLVEKLLVDKRTGWLRSVYQ